MKNFLNTGSHNWSITYHQWYEKTSLWPFHSDFMILKRLASRLRQTANGNLYHMTKFLLYLSLRGRPFNSWGRGWVISGHQAFFSSNLVGRIFFPFFSHKLSITFVLHAIFFFRQELAGNFFSKSPTPPPPSRVKWSAPYCSLFLHINLCFTQFFVQLNYFELFLSAHFLLWEILNLNLTFAVCPIREE